MGLTAHSTGLHAVDSGLVIRRATPEDRVVAIAGNPNVGKSTVFNALTGMNQHTGNWPGKTVTNVQGYWKGERHSYVMVDIPGAYSLMAHSTEEEVARNFLCFGKPDVTVVVCDATCLERNLNLVLQTMELSGRVLVCVNLLDEAKRKGIYIDLKKLEQRLGVPVVGTVARNKRSLHTLVSALDALVDAPERECLRLQYPQPIQAAVAELEPALSKNPALKANARWLSLRLLDADESLVREMNVHASMDLWEDAEIKAALGRARDILQKAGIDHNALRDQVVETIIHYGERICDGCVLGKKDNGYSARDRKLDKILTGRLTGYPVMLLLLALVFWLTIAGANVPSALLGDALFWVQDRLTELFFALGAPDWLHGALVLGVYRVLAWVVSVMLPPMAIFFPLFTLLEDLGYLPRIAYNLDKSFQKCCACGKQALCMWKGLFSATVRRAYGSR